MVRPVAGHKPARKQFRPRARPSRQPAGRAGESLRVVRLCTGAVVFGNLTP
jgi:hypothetical protein